MYVCMYAISIATLVLACAIGIAHLKLVYNEPLLCFQIKVLTIVNEVAGEHVHRVL